MTHTFPVSHQNGIQQYRLVSLVRLEAGVRVVVVKQHVRTGHVQRVRQAAEAVDIVRVGQHAAASAQWIQTGHGQRLHLLGIRHVFVHAFCR